MATKKTTPKVKQTKNSLFKIVLEMAGVEYAGEGQTIQEAIDKLPINYTHIKTKGVLSVIQDGRKTEKLFYLRPLRLFFASKVRRAGFIRQLEELLKVKSVTVNP